MSSERWFGIVMSMIIIIIMIIMISNNEQILRCLLSVGLLVGEAAAWLSLLGQLGGEVVNMVVMIKNYADSVNFIFIYVMIKKKLTIVRVLGEHIHPPLPPHSHISLLPALAGHQVNLTIMITTTTTINTNVIILGGRS